MWSINRAVLFLQIYFKWIYLSFECILDLPIVTNHTVFTPQSQGDIKDQFTFNFMSVFTLTVAVFQCHHLYNSAFNLNKLIGHLKLILLYL